MAQYEFTSHPTAKGQVLLSTTFSVNQKEGENEVSIIQTFEQRNFFNWDITLRSGYFIKDNFAVGGFFVFEENNSELKYTSDNQPVLDESRSINYGIAPFIRNYLPLGDGRFMLFNETYFEFNYGSSVRQITTLDDINRVTSTSYNFTLGLQPGIAAFINEKVSVEVGTSLLGLNSSVTQSVTNGDTDNPSRTVSNNVDFKINLLTLFVGVTFYFPS
ncbi:MAG: hypothetical protein SchgKO_13090 [Schleiferiaceae bacterium]